jgi:hypothetical protein
MGVIDSINKTTDKIADSGGNYLKKSEEYYKLKVFQQLTISISVVAKVLIIGGLLFSALFFMAFAVALAIGDWLDNLALGYLIIGVLFVILVIIAYLKRNVINRKVVQALSNKFFDS